MKPVVAFTACSLLVTLIAACGGGGGGGGGGKKVVVVGDQGPRIDYHDLAVVDFDRDGLNDLVVTSVSIDPAAANRGNVSVFLQSNAGTFAAPAVFLYGLNLSPYELVVTDLQQDLLPDLIASGPGEPGFRVMLQNPQEPGTLLASSHFGALNEGSNWIDVASEDLNLDGLPDVLLVNDERVVYHLQDAGAAGAFLGEQAVGEGAEEVATGDLNGDGLMDVVTFDADESTDHLLYYRHDPALIGRFLPPLRLAVDFAAQAVAVADLDGDSRPDIVVAGFDSPAIGDYEGYWTVFRQTRAGVFSRDPKHRTHSDLFASKVEVADLNDDRRPDLVVGNRTSADEPNSVEIYLQSATGTFPSGSSILLPDSAALTVPEMGGLGVGDLNGDGLPDIAVSTHEIFVLYQTSAGIGSFGSPVRIAGQR